MTIKFIHTPIEQIDQLCKEEQIVKVMISTYQIEALKDGTIVEVETGGFGATIKSSKDLVQFDNEDMKTLSRETKHKLMLEQLHRVVSTQQIRIDPKFRGIISALRTATTKQFGDVYDLDKKQSGSNDLLDALRLSLLCLRSNN